MRHRQIHRKPQRRSIFREAPGIALGVVAMVGAGVYSLDGFPTIAATVKGCDVKGNISMNSGEKIFHVPGQEYYAATRISPRYGERWFCSEAEAQAAGWRKARN